jgi:para-aminobenzoate synthetase component 1
MNRITETFEPLDKARILQWASSFDPCIIFDSHSAENPEYPNGFTYELLIAVGQMEALVSCEKSIDKLQEFHERHKDWLFGYLSYDLKNEFENLSSTNSDHHKLPHIHFFVPEIVLYVKDNRLTISGGIELPLHIYAQIESTEVLPMVHSAGIDIRPRMHHSEYIKGVHSLLHHIQMGDIYEANFCQEFYSENVDIQPFSMYQKLMRMSPTPFSAYVRTNSNYLMCASPERYLQKKGNRILSQPIKGTAKRGNTSEEDAELKLRLANSPKDRTENVMIVDLVRNDLSRTAAPQTVHVDELFGVYSFSNVHQMISTISSELKSSHHFTDVLKSSFPMGSMTGAPKIMAMKLIDEFEFTQRGLYSGSVGYITPEGDFDFNVVIRSLQYNAANKYLSYMVGGAITRNSVPEDEFTECEVKAAAIKSVLRGQ